METKDNQFEHDATPNPADDAEWEGVEPESREGRFQRILISTVMASLVVLLLVYMFSDRQPPEVPKEKGALQLTVPLDDNAADTVSAPDTQNLVPVTPYTSQDGFSGGGDAGSSAAASLPQHSTMAVRQPRRPDAAPPTSGGALLQPLPSVAGDKASDSGDETARPERQKAVPASPSREHHAAEDTVTAKRKRALDEEVRQAQSPLPSAGSDASLAGPAAVPSTASVQTRAPGAADERFAVQFGAFREREYAERLAARLQDLGLKVRLMPVAGGVFKVQSEAFQTREQAQKLADFAQSTGQTGAMVTPLK